MWPSKGTMKLGHSRQVVAKYWFNQYEMHCEGKTNYCNYMTEKVTMSVIWSNSLWKMNLSTILLQLDLFVIKF
jgi:hypothetical protein